MTKCELMFDSSRNKEVEIRECVIDAIDLIQRIYEAAFPKLVSQGQQGDSARQDFTAFEQLHGKPNRKLTESLFKVVWEMSVLRGPIPTCIYITGARQHDVLWLDELLFEPGAFYVMDRGYMDFKRLHRIAAAGAFFVTRAKDNLRFSRQRSLPVDYPAGVRSDQIGKPLPLQHGSQCRLHVAFVVNHHDRRQPIFHGCIHSPISQREMRRS